MQIGINLIAFNAQHLLEDCLKPWLALNTRGEHYVIISASYGVFPEVAALGDIKIDNTAAVLKTKLGGEIDYLFVSESPIYEKDLRNKSLDSLLVNNPDLIFLVDVDEHWTVPEIENVLKFVEERQSADWFRVNFKNYIGDKTYVKDFLAPRIWRTERNLGISNFFDDNAIKFMDNSKQYERPYLDIPREVAFPKHLSWTGNKEYLKQKILFQINHYKISSFRWNDAEDKLEFNPEYYQKSNKPIPEVFKD